MKRSVILTDRLGPNILLVLTMKRQVLHRERAHLIIIIIIIIISFILHCSHYITFVEVSYKTKLK